MWMTRRCEAPWFGPVLLILGGIATACAWPRATQLAAPPVVEAEKAPRALLQLEPQLRALVQEGEVLWQRPPLAENTVACATCHVDGAELRGWAASFPKVKPMPRPFTRVMTLQQAVGEAVATHYRIPPGAPNRSAARAIAAYLTWVGEGRPISPGLAPGRPPFPDRLAALRKSVTQGQAYVERTCARCHPEGAALDEAAATFPRVPRDGGGVVTLEEYLERHAGLIWNGPEATDVAAYLVTRSTGRLVQPAAASKPLSSREDPSNELAVRPRPLQVQ
jgi:hypothetical protein